MSILTAEFPLWSYLLLSMSVTAAVARVWRSDLAQARGRLHEQAAQHAADAERLVEWHNGVWRRWQGVIVDHAERYDRYWCGVSEGLLQAMLARGGDANLHSLIRGALQGGRTPMTVAHSIAVHHARDAAFMREWSRFAMRTPKAGPHASRERRP
jgi:hypothetical protein